MEDYKGITGDYADTNRDGKVDFVEYDNDCYDFEHICKKKSWFKRLYSTKSKRLQGLA